MTARFVPSLQEILYRLVGAASDASLKQPPSEKPGRFPVVVRPETRAFLEAQADYLGGSIAGVAGAILDGVAMTTQGGASSLRGVAERFNILIQEHQLSFPAAVEVLGDLGFTLADFASIETLQLKLSSPVLRSVAERFYVEYDWLAGKGDQVFMPTPHCWYKEMEKAADILVDARRLCANAELTLYVKKDTNLDMVDDDQDWNRLPHFLPVLTRTKAIAGGEALETFEVWDEGRWSYWRCRQHIKLVVYFAYRLGIHVTGKRLAPTDYDLLINGKAVPATVLHRNPGVVSWHPDDYVLPHSPVAKAAEEWTAIAANPDYASTFEYFTSLLNREGATR
jgi:hypothetical protein